MWRFYKQWYIDQRLYWILGGIAFLFLMAYWFTVVYAIAMVGLWLLAIAFFLDMVFLFRRGDGLSAERVLPEKFSNSDMNQVRIRLQNRYPFPIRYLIVDEIPEQFQKRDFGIKGHLSPAVDKELDYGLQPYHRGEYFFGDLHVFVSSPLSLARRRFSFQKGQMVKVYPSFVQMQKLGFLADSQINMDYGLKRVRRIGHTMEFEQIKEYIPGDDVRTINWKASAKLAHLMINQFQDEKAQPIYLLLDTGRVMKMPFGGLSLLDYSINSALAFANVAIKKSDKAGLIAFSNNIHSSLPASNRKTHLMAFMESLYRVQTRFPDTDFGLLYAWVKRKINQRSLLLLFTNFEHSGALERQLPYLRGLAKQHLLVVIFFENSLLVEEANKSVDKLSGIFQKTIAGKFVYDKRLMCKELNRHGIQTIICEPQDLSVEVINKYLEIKARGIL